MMEIYDIETYAIALSVIVTCFVVAVLISKTAAVLYNIRKTVCCVDCKGYVPIGCGKRTLRDPIFCPACTLIKPDKFNYVTGEKCLQPCHNENGHCKFYQQKDAPSYPTDLPHD